MKPGKSVLQKLWEKTLILEHAVKASRLQCVFAKDVEDGSGAILIGLKGKNGSFTPLARLLTKIEIDRLKPVFEADLEGLYGDARESVLKATKFDPSKWTPEFFEKVFPEGHALTESWWEIAEDLCEWLAEHFRDRNSTRWIWLMRGPDGEA
jgi:hypothetical protein